jgi:hypothetical protein
VRNPIVFILDRRGVRHYPVNPSDPQTATWCHNEFMLTHRDGEEALYDEIVTVTVHGEADQPSEEEIAMRETTTVCSVCLLALERTYLEVHAPGVRS